MTSEARALAYFTAVMVLGLVAILVLLRALAFFMDGQ